MAESITIPITVDLVALKRLVHEALAEAGLLPAPPLGAQPSWREAMQQSTAPRVSMPVSTAEFLALLDATDDPFLDGGEDE